MTTSGGFTSERMPTVFSSFSFSRVLTMLSDLDFAVFIDSAGNIDCYQTSDVFVWWGGPVPDLSHMVFQKLMFFSNISLVRATVLKSFFSSDGYLVNVFSDPSGQTVLTDATTNNWVHYSNSLYD